MSSGFHSGSSGMRASPEVTGRASVAAGDAHESPPVRRRRRAHHHLIGLVGVGLLLIGLQGPALLVVGVPAVARVESVREDARADPTDHAYEIVYRFDVAGREYTGTYLVEHVYSEAALPAVGSPVAVRHLPLLPAVHRPDHLPGLMGMAAVSLLTGLALIWFGWKR